MSLNRCEQVFYDYLAGQKEERQFWTEKVRRVSASGDVSAYTVDGLERDLWSAFLERSRMVRPLGDWVRANGASRTSMKNLAEYLIRVWGEPQNKRQSPPTVKTV